jgi:hypothetical protein
MLPEKDFEALGRYVDASETVNRLAAERHNLASEMTQMLRKASLWMPEGTISIFDHAGFLKKAGEIARVNEDILIAVEQMNACAAGANRRTMRWV